MIGTYKNGNYVVSIYEDGTKIRETQEDAFLPEFAENIDIKICNRCNKGCPMCHEKSTIDGALGDLNAPFFDTLKPYQEIAVGGGNVLEHPGLVDFLKRMKEKHVICNITLHQDHFLEYMGFVKALSESHLVYGIGVSLSKINDKLIKALHEVPNTVLHVIAGMLTKEQLLTLKDADIKMLILGYKTFGRGEVFFDSHENEIKKNISDLKELLPKVVDQFKVVSFDNLAIEQLDIKSLLTPEEWAEFYMGDEGSFTFYIDAVNKKFAENSIAPLENRYDLLDDVTDMFKVIKEGH